MERSEKSFNDVLFCIESFSISILNPISYEESDTIKIGCNKANENKIIETKTKSIPTRKRSRLLEKKRDGNLRHFCCRRKTLGNLLCLFLAFL